MKKIFLSVLFLLNTILAVILIKEADVSGLYLYFNLTLIIISNICFALYILNKINVNRLLSIGFVFNFYSVLSISAYISLLIVILTSYLKLPLNYDVVYIFSNMFIEFSIIFLTYLLFYKGKLKTQFKDFYKNIFFYITIALAFYLVSILINNIFDNIISLFPLEDSIPANQESINEILNLTSMKSIYIINLVILGPITEEFIFRYLLIEEVLLKTFKNDNFIKILALTILSGLFFAMFHAIAADSIIYFIRDLILYSGTAFVLSYAYLRYRNIYLSISIHIFNNLLAVLIILSL